MSETTFQEAMKAADDIAATLTGCTLESALARVTAAHEAEVAGLRADLEKTRENLAYRERCLQEVADKWPTKRDTRGDWQAKEAAFEGLELADWQEGENLSWCVLRDHPMRERDIMVAQAACNAEHLRQMGLRRAKRIAALTARAEAAEASEAKLAAIRDSGPECIMLLDEAIGDLAGMAEGPAALQQEACAAVPLARDAVAAQIAAYARDHEAMEYLRSEGAVISGVLAHEPGVWFPTDWDGDQASLESYVDPADAILAARDGDEDDLFVYCPDGEMLRIKVKTTVARSGSRIAADLPIYAAKKEGSDA